MRKFSKIALVILLTVCALAPSHAQDIQQLFQFISGGVKAEFAPDSRDKTYDVRLFEQKGKLTLVGSTTEPAAKEALLQRLKDAGLNPVDKIRLLPDAALGGRTYGVVCMSVASFNSDPSFSAESGTQALAGMPVTVLERGNGYWYRCINMEGYTAWVITSSVSRMNKEEYDAYLAMPKCIVTVPYSYIYSQPSESSLPVSDLVLGCVLVNDEVKTDNPVYEKFIEETYDYNLKNGYNLSSNRKSLKKASGWTRVHMADGRAGYVKSSHLEDFNKWLSKAAPTQENIVATAKKFLGWPYVWGGTSIKGIDCSGLSKTCYFLNGYVLRRDASQQVKTGDEVNIDDWLQGTYTHHALRNLKPGDLLFFGRKATAERGERITHVAIYIGDGKIIHSSNVVRMNTLIPNEENYYSGAVNLLRARRIIGNADCDKGIRTVKSLMTK